MLKTSFFFIKWFIILFITCQSSVAQIKSDSLYLFLRPTNYIDCDNEEVVKKALELTKYCKTESEKAKVLYEFVRDSYSLNQFESYKASDILSLGGNLCYQRSILLSALCRAVNIPSRLHAQMVTIKNYKYDSGKVDDLTFIHGITGIYIDRKWILYESVGNNQKWYQWVQNSDSTVDFTIKYYPDKNCLFNQTDKVRIITLPVYFHDHTAFLVELGDKIINGEIGFY